MAGAGDASDRRGRGGVWLVELNGEALQVTNNNNGTFTLIKDSDTLTFSESTGDVIVVPEPAVTLVGMAGLVATLAVRRRRRTQAGTSDAP